MPKATVLVETTPGGGPAVLTALDDDACVVRRMATLGRPGAVVQVETPDDAALLATLERINAVPAQTGSEALLDMGLGDAPPALDAAGARTAVLLVMESKDAGCAVAHSLFRDAMAIPGVVAATPLLGRIDDVVWVHYDDVDDLARIVAAVEALTGVRSVEVLVGA